MAAEILLVSAPAAGVAQLVFAAVGGLLWLFWALSAAYLLVLLLAAALHRRRARPVPAETRRICILIPAHDEELLIGEVVERLHEQSYPADSYRIVVIADNCTDRTAEVARSGDAEVLERTNPDQRGKGYALDWALRQLLATEDRIDAVLILDADSFLSSDFLAAMNAALAQGHGAIQGRYDVLNVSEGWRTRLMACALALAHYVKPLGRNALGLSDGLKGNGMCFSRATLEKVPWSGESITEDIEYTLRLVQAGIRIEFAPEAVVRAQMPTSGKQAATQRERWEGGRYALLRRAIRLFFQGLRARRVMVMDRAVELIIPPFVEMFALPILMLATSALWLRFAPESGVARWMLVGWAGVLAAELIYLAGGLAVARVPAAVALSLLFAPFYIVWKLGLYAAMILRGGPSGWRRTDRREITEGVVE